MMQVHDKNAHLQTLTKRQTARRARRVQCLCPPAIAVIWPYAKDLDFMSVLTDVDRLHESCGAEQSCKQSSPPQSQSRGCSGMPHHASNVLTVATDTQRSGKVRTGSCSNTLRLLSAAIGPLYKLLAERSVRSVSKTSARCPRAGLPKLKVSTMPVCFGDI